MRKIKVEEAVGQTLCHDMTAILENGYKGVRFKRGHLISEEDIPVLKDMGKDHIFVWEPDANEVHEEDAAQILSEAMCGDHVVKSAPSEGKIGFTSDVKGLVGIDVDALRKINQVPDYTVALVPDGFPVEAGGRLGGARIVPLVTAQENVDRAEAIAKEAFPVLTVMPYGKKKVAMIITGSEIYYGRIQDAFEPILRKKLEAFDAEVLGVTKCPDDTEMILSAIKQFREQGADLILLTGGMSVDPDDVTPTAIARSGARVAVRGVPMQPGNMLNVAYLENTVLVGVPGASMHSPITSLDVFLPWIFAGREITKEAVSGCGDGGLCLGCKECRWPNCYFGFGRR